jgi:hypothetical protein
LLFNIRLLKIIYLKHSLFSYTLASSRVCEAYYSGFFFNCQVLFASFSLFFAFFIFKKN